jgi:hypothetical protein
MSIITQRKCMDLEITKGENSGCIWIQQAGDLIQIELEKIEELFKVLNEINSLNKGETQ